MVEVINIIVELEISNEKINCLLYIITTKTTPQSKYAYRANMYTLFDASLAIEVQKLLGETYPPPSINITPVILTLYYDGWQ